MSEQDKSEVKVKKSKKKFVIKTSFFSDLKKFLFKGNVMDLAVAVIVGAAFGKITSSLVSDVIMPLIVLLYGGVHLTELHWTLYTGATVNYGNFLQAIIEFLIIGVTIFIVVRIVKRVTSIKFTSKEEAEAAARKLLEEQAAEEERKEKERLACIEAEQKAQQALESGIASEALLREILAELKKR